MIVETYQLSFHVFICAFHPEISSFSIKVSSFYFYFCVNLLYTHICIAYFLIDIEN
jgi:hypothetical protein